MARHVADAVPAAGRRNLWRLGEMACGPEGRLYVEFLTGAREGDRWVGPTPLHPVDPDVVRAGARRSGGGTVVERQDQRPGWRRTDDVQDGGRWQS